MKQQKERESNISRVAEVAKDLFIENGVGSTSVGEIADKANLTSMSVYRYFGNKRGLVISAWKNAINTFYALFMDEYAREAERAENGFQKFLICMGLYVRLYHAHPKWFAYMQEMITFASREKMKGKEIFSLFRAISERTVPSPALDALMLGVEDGSIRDDIDIRLTYQCLLNACTGGSAYECAGRGVSPIDVIKFTGDLIANYIKK